MEERGLPHVSAKGSIIYVFNRNGGIKQRSNIDRKMNLAAKEGTIQPAQTAVENIQMQQH